MQTPTPLGRLPAPNLALATSKAVGGPCDDSCSDRHIRAAREATRVIDEYGFEPLLVEIRGLTHEYEVRWKLLPATDGPPGYPGEPYIPLAVSFAMTSGERRRQGHLDYALSRSYWAEQRPPAPTEEDGQTLSRLVAEQLPRDLKVIDVGDDPEALRTNRTPRFLRPRAGRQ
jgi:hypothetical protein